MPRLPIWLDLDAPDDCVHRLSSRAPETSHEPIGGRLATDAGSESRRGLSCPARGRDVHHSEPLGRRLGESARGARLQGTRDHEPRFCVHARAARRRRDARRGRSTTSGCSPARPPLPVSVDLENGYGPDPESAASAITAAAGAGAVGGSIEDYDREAGIYSFDHAVKRIAAACEAARGLSFPFTLTARAENLIRGNPDLDDTIARLQAYERAGADVLFRRAPERGRDPHRYAATSKPVNVLTHAGLSMREIVAAGARRVSVGGALAWAAVAALACHRREDARRGRLLAAHRAGRVEEWLAG